MNLANSPLANKYKETVSVSRDDGNFDTPLSFLRIDGKFYTETEKSFNESPIAGIEIVILPVPRAGVIDQVGVVRTEYDFDGWFIIANSNVKQGDLLTRPDSSVLIITHSATVKSNDDGNTTNIQQVELTKQEGS